MLDLCSILIDLLRSVFSIDLFILSVSALSVLSFFFIVFHLISGKRVFYK